jgi:hypothetical protein
MINKKRQAKEKPDERKSHENGSARVCYRIKSLEKNDPKIADSE